MASASTGKGSNVLISETFIDEDVIGFNGDVDGILFAGVDGSTIDNSDNRITNSGNTTTIYDSSDRSVTSTDHKAVDSAFDFGEQALGLARSVVQAQSASNYDALRAVSGASSDAFSSITTFAGRAFGAIDSAFDGLDDAYGRSLDGLSNAVGKVTDATSKQMGAFADATRSETAASFDKLVKYAAIGGIIITLAIVVTRRGSKI